MKRALFALAVALLVAAAGLRILRHDVSTPSPPIPEPSAAVADRTAEALPPDFLYGRVTTVVGVSYEGRLRWGGGQEAFWGDYFNGAKPKNRWAAFVPPERLPQERYPIEIFGFEIARRERPADLGRLFLARFGDIARLEARGGIVRVTLKSGIAFDLDRLEASDFDDGVRVWDGRRGVVDLDSLEIRSIEFLPVPELPGEPAAPDRLFGTVRTRQGDFTGFLQWDREKGVGSDELSGEAAGKPLRLRFDTLRSIARRSPESARVTRGDGRAVELSGTSDVGRGHRGTYVDDPRYGRVLVSWEAFERADFRSGGSGPAYGDFPPGGPLAGSVTTRAGRRLAGRLVYDLDESETTETLDAPSRGVDYTIPFGRIASIQLPGPEARARVILQSGEVLQLERQGDLGEKNAGLLVFAAGRPRPEYVPWTEVARVDFGRPGQSAAERR